MKGFLQVKCYFRNVISLLKDPQCWHWAWPLVWQSRPALIWTCLSCAVSDISRTRTLHPGSLFLFHYLLTSLFLSLSPSFSMNPRLSPFRSALTSLNPLGSSAVSLWVWFMYNESMAEVSEHLTLNLFFYSLTFSLVHSLLPYWFLLLSLLAGSGYLTDEWKDFCVSRVWKWILCMEEVRMRTFCLKMTFSGHLFSFSFLFVFLS